LDSSVCTGKAGAVYPELLELPSSWQNRTKHFEINRLGKNSAQTAQLYEANAERTTPHAAFDWFQNKKAKIMSNKS